jgi:hypothetical protein
MGRTWKRIIDLIEVKDGIIDLETDIEDPRVDE